MRNLIFSFAVVLVSGLAALVSGKPSVSDDVYVQASPGLYQKIVGVYMTDQCTLGVNPCSFSVAPGDTTKYPEMISLERARSSGLVPSGDGVYIR